MGTSDTKTTYMQAALQAAQDAYEQDEVPVGAVIVDHDTGDILAQFGNRTRAMKDPTGHAEILAIRQVCKLQNAQRIPETDLYVTLEPCPMCAAAISYARIANIYIGALDTKSGGILSGPKIYENPALHHKPNVEHGILEQVSADLLKSFFKEKRKKKRG